MSDFSTTLAQMIAQARPTFQAPGGGGAQVVPGPQGLAAKAKAVDTKIGIQIPSKAQWQQMVGEPTDATQRSMAEAAYQTFNFLNTTMDPEQLKAIVDSPDYQSKMAKWHSVGHPAILAEPDTESGEMRYSWVPGAPDKDAFNASMETALKQTDPEAWKRMKGGGATEPQIAAGMAGEPARQTYVDTQSSIAGATYGAKAKAEMQYVHPAITELRKAEAENQRAAAQYHRAQAGAVGGDDAKTRAEINKLEAETLKARAETEKLIQGASVDPMAKEGANEANKAFDDFYKSFIVKNSNMPDDERSNFRKNNELGAAVLSHVSAMKYYMGTGEAGKRSLVRWFSTVDREFDRADITSKKSWIPGVGAPQASIDQLARRRQYYKMGLDIIREAGGMDSGTRDKMYKWGRLLGYGDETIKKELQGALGMKPAAPAAPAAPPALPAPNMGTPSYLMRPEGRAEGGPVNANQPYIVGEKGEPEMFVPEQNGTIVPMGGSSGGGASTHPSAKSFMDREESFTRTLTEEVDLIDQSIMFARSQNPGKTISPELLEHRQQLQDMLGKQQERLMRVHGKHMSTYQKKDEKKKEGGNGND